MTTIVKSPRFSVSGIEYLDRMWGIFSGCDNLRKKICHVTRCWAKGVVARSAPSNYPLGFDMPTYYPEAADSPKHFKQSLVIAVGWVGDVIGYGLSFREKIFSTIRETPWHTYLFLTKNFEDIQKWQLFPDNCRVGVTVNDDQSASAAYYGLASAMARSRWISFEPLFGAIRYENLAALATVSDWWVIGGQTSPERLPDIESVKLIVEVADKFGISVFLKNNLKPLFEVEKNTKWVIPEWAASHDELSFGLRQELPEASKLKSSGVTA